MTKSINFRFIEHNFLFRYLFAIYLLTLAVNLSYVIIPFVSRINILVQFWEAGMIPRNERLEQTVLYHRQYVPSLQQPEMDKD